MRRNNSSILLNQSFKTISGLIKYLRMIPIIIWDRIKSLTFLNLTKIKIAK